MQRNDFPLRRSIQTLFSRGAWILPRLKECSSFLRRIHSLEDLVCTCGLFLMALLPLSEIILRTLFSVGIPGSAIWTQHLVLWAAFLGAGIAARENQLLSLSTENLIPSSLSRHARVIKAGVSLCVCLVLTMGAGYFVQVERQGGQRLALDLPVWIPQLIIPAGFLLIGLRTWLNGCKHSKERLLSALFLAVPLGLALLPQWRNSFVAWGLSLAVVIGMIAGAPIFIGLAGLAAALLWSGWEPISAIPVEVYNLTVKPLLPTIPLFTLAGYILASGGTPERLVRLFRALFGWAPGGIAVVAILACAFFTSFTGGSGVTIVALGGLMYPMLAHEKYGDKLATGLLTSAGSLGLLLPPSLAVILFGVVAQVDIRQLFASGLLPAAIEISLVMVFVIFFARRSAVERVPFNWVEAATAVRQGAWEMAIPLVVLVSIFGGFATLPETSAVTVLYAFILEFLVRRNLSLKKDLLKVVGSASTLIGGVLLILGVAMGLTNFLIIEEIPLAATNWVQSHVGSPLLFLLLLNLFLLVVGCLMDIYSAITVMVPLLMPIGLAFGIDPLHLGIIFLINLELGYLTPPVGMNLFLAAYRFDRRLDEVYRAALPFLGIRIIAVALVTYIPGLTSWVPKLAGLR